MIKAAHLRIGNKLQTVVSKQVVTLKSIVADNDDYILTFEEGNGCYTTSLKSNHVEPIPLTPEILERWGFEITNDGNIIHIYNGYFALNGYLNGGEYFWLRWYQAGTQPKIKYLHQLQNIHFDFTGTELEFKESVNQ